MLKQGVNVIKNELWLEFDTERVGMKETAEIGGH